MFLLGSPNSQVAAYSHADDNNGTADFFNLLLAFQSNQLK